jgi:hypothetical protein
MYLLYLDDSGSINNKNEEYFVLGGIALHESSVRWLTNEIETLANSVLPENPSDVEFHAAEIFSGRTFPWIDRSKSEKISIIQNVLHVLDKAYSKAALFACAVHKSSFPSEDSVLMAYEQVSNSFNYYIQRWDSSQRGLIILDNSSHESGLQTLTLDIRKKGNRWGNQLRQLAEVPLFVDSRPCRIIQLADHIAYAVFRRYNANDLTYFNTIESRFDQHEGVVSGLIHKQLVNRNCTCPACYSRNHAIEKK